MGRGTPLRGKNSGRVVAFIEEEIVARHGCPERIILDGGSVYASREIEVFYESNGIRHQVTALYHAEGNKQVKWTIGTLK